MARLCRLGAVSPQPTSPVLRQLDAFCARVNGGLTVFTVLLAIVAVAVACAQRLPEIASLFQPIDPETGISMPAY
jgi:hypothetical protein